MRRIVGLFVGIFLMMFSVANASGPSGLILAKKIVSRPFTTSDLVRATEEGYKEVQEHPCLRVRSPLHKDFHITFSVEITAQTVTLTDTINPRSCF